VGSTAPFDELVSKVDLLAGRSFEGNFTAQIGNGEYIPKNAKWFRFKDSLAEDYLSADLIVTHTGAGTLFEIVRSGKKAIAVPNPNVIQNHDIADRLSRDGYLLFCPSLDMLEERIVQAKTWAPKKYVEEPCLIGEDIVSFLQKVKRG
jgi:beta-1,4-N-acetylglucosaminyltransferase